MKKFLLICLLFFSFSYVFADTQYIAGATMYQQKESAVLKGVGLDSLCNGIDYFSALSVNNEAGTYGLCLPFDGYINMYLKDFNIGIGAGLGFTMNMLPIENMVSYPISSTMLFSLKTKVDFEFLETSIVTNLLLGIETNLLMFGTNTNEGIGTGIYIGVYPWMVSFNDNGSIKPDAYYRIMLGISVCVGRRFTKRNQ